MLCTWIGLLVLLSAGGLPAQTKKKGSTTVNADRKYIKENIEEYLTPTKVQFLKGGRIKLVFDFRAKNDAHEDIFLPGMKSGPKAQMRWSTDEEEWYIGSWPGIRISDQGMALLDFWFEDELEAQIEMGQHVTHNKRLITAVVFCNPKALSVGSNFGTQCMMFKGRKVAKKSGKKASSVAYNTTVKVKLVVKDGKFEARRGAGSRAKDTMTYSEKSFETGRVGFIWGGSTAATIRSLEITGKVDVERTAKAMRRQLERRR